ncbi:transposase [Planomonospora sp. ID91781]|uniref:transposase n=1 Tax=Planomonospora sp. ID91781 TaxID=2738135 RepID=UPI0018C44895
MATSAVTGRFGPTGAQRVTLEPLLPEGVRSGRPVAWSKRRLIDGIRWRVRTGAPWRDVPRYGPCRRPTDCSGAGSGPECGRVS